MQMTQEAVIKDLLDRVKYIDGEIFWSDPGRRSDLLGKKCGSISSTDGYVYVKFMQRRILVHRVIFYLHNGYYPIEIDHINRVRSDNRIENLREATSHSNNLGNQSKQVRAKTSRYKGVCWDKNRNLWAAGIKYEGKRYNLGRYLNEEEAAEAYDIASRNFFGDFSHCNDIEMHNKAP